MQDILIKHLSFGYGPERLILEDLDLSVETGSFVCLLGPSGCGKSTFLRLLAGLEHPTSGKITVEGKRIERPGLDRGMVFQDYGLFPWMTAGENIMLALEQRFPGDGKKRWKETALENIRAVGLDESVFDKLPRELSGGMKQSCAIARSFAVDPPVLLMDEPFGALDAVTRARLQDLVLRLWAGTEPRKTVFFVTHDVDEALLLANRILVFGQSPSRVIYDCTIPPEKRPTRETQFDDLETLKLRNTLIHQINSDVNRRIA